MEKMVPKQLALYMLEHDSNEFHILRIYISSIFVLFLVQGVRPPSHHYMPYRPVILSLNQGKCGALKVKMIKMRIIRMISIMEA